MAKPTLPRANTKAAPSICCISWLTATRCAKYGLTPSCDFSSGCHPCESDRPLSAQCGLDRSSQRGISAFRVPGRRASERIGPFVASGACAKSSVSADLLLILSPWEKFTLQKSDCQGHASRHSYSNEGTANGSPCGGTECKKGPQNHDHQICFVSRGGISRQT